MTKRDHFLQILDRKSTHCGFWHGYPNPASIDYLYKEFGVKDDHELGIVLGSNCRWVLPREYGVWAHPEGKSMFGFQDWSERESLSQPGIFADCESVHDVESYKDWPDVKYISLERVSHEIDRAVDAGQAVLSGMWACFFHDVADYFGMEDYFVKMHTDPDVVEAVTDHVVNFYMQANDLLFKKCADRMDMYFFGNDFGSQLDLMISPEAFRRFMLPSIRKLADQARSYGLRLMTHSCGSIGRIIPDLIDTGIEILHPIQAKAVGMDAKTLKKNFGDHLIFMGGVDTQELLPFGTPQEVRDEVRRLKDIFGPNYIVSPSHESILPGVTAENIRAMADAAAE